MEQCNWSDEQNDLDDPLPLREYPILMFRQKSTQNHHSFIVTIENTMDADNYTSSSAVEDMRSIWMMPQSTSSLDEALATAHPIKMYNSLTRSKVL